MKIKIFSAAAFAGIFIFVCSRSEKIKQGNEIAAKIKNFQRQNDRLPNSLIEVGVVETESGPIYYQKQSDTKYILWFGKGLGESEIYNSETKQWK